MSFFKDFKDDFTQAMDEMLPGAEEKETKEDVMVDTLGDEADAKEEIAKLDSLLEKVTSVPEKEQKPTEPKNKVFKAPVKEETPVVKEDIKVSEESTVSTVQSERPVATDEVTIITNGTIIHGNIESNGSLEIRGNVEGDVACNGKLTVTGNVNGNSSASEVFADSANIDGEISSSGTVKIGLGSVVIGNIAANSAVIAGAIKGDIDVHGPVVVDTSAVVMGNIKSRSVQINNGAVIEGFCSQCYSDVDVESLFNEKKGKA